LVPHQELHIRRVPDRDWEDTSQLDDFAHVVEVNDLSIPVIDLEFEQRAYRDLGREEKVKLISEAFQGRKPSE
jgi:hypothetical protein